MTLQYCPWCQLEIDPKVDKNICPFCKKNLHAPAQKASIILPAKRVRSPVNIDLAITLDRTGSTLQFQKGIPLIFRIIFKLLTAKATGVKCWFQTHGDEDYKEFPILHTDGGTPKQVQEDLKKVVYFGGYDPPETHLSAIKNLLYNTPFTSNPNKSRGAILGIMNADTKPLRCGMTPKQLGLEIKKRNILLYLVCECTPSLLELCEAAEGMMFQITNTPDPEELKEIGEELAKSIVVSVTHGTQPMMAAIP